MKYRKLGNSGLITSVLTLGTMIFGDETSEGTSPRDAEKIIHRYLDAGGNHIDTADIYVSGRSEEIVGKAIHDRRQKVVLATKVRNRTGDGQNDVGSSRIHIMEAVDASLHRMNTDYIDLYYLHVWDPITPIEESLRALDDLVSSGKVRYIGVSNFKAWQVMKSLCVSDAHGWNRFIAAQYLYNIADRDIEYEFSDLCLEEGIGILPWGPLGGGFFSGKYKRGRKPTKGEGRVATAIDDYEESWKNKNIERNWNTLEVLEEAAHNHNATVSQVSLAWLLSQPAVSSVVMGVRTMDQLEDNLGTAEVELTQQELQKLDQVSRLPDQYPDNFIRSWGKRELQQP